MTIKTLIAAIASLTLAIGAAQANTDCEKQAADKKLHGAAKTSFVKKCAADAAPAKSPAAEACDIVGQLFLDGFRFGKLLVASQIKVGRSRKRPSCHKQCE